MKCLNCSNEFQDDMNFCPKCGTKAGKQKNIETVVKVTTNYTELYESISLLALYFGIGMSLVCLFFAFKGFGIITKKIDALHVWITFAVSVLIGAAGGFVYFKKFHKRKK